jgi:hypothetical protein
MIPIKNIPGLFLQVGIQKMHAFFFLTDSKEKKQTGNLRVLADFKRKTQDCLKVSHTLRIPV